MRTVCHFLDPCRPGRYKGFLAEVRRALGLAFVPRAEGEIEPVTSSVSVQGTHLVGSHELAMRGVVAVTSAVTDLLWLIRRRIRIVAHVLASWARAV